MDWVTIIIPLVAIVLGIAIPLSAIWTEYKRDKVLIEKGLYQPKQPKPLGPPGWGLLLGGSILTGIGIALTVSAFIFQIGKPIGIPGFIFLFIGIALIVVYFVAKKRVGTGN